VRSLHPPNPAASRPSVPAATRRFGLRSEVHRVEDDALLFRKLATLRTDHPAFGQVDELRWTGPAGDFPALCERLGARDLPERAAALER
jgi:hypothetical protein